VSLHFNFEQLQISLHKISLSDTPFLYIRTPNFGAGAESSYIFGRFEAENVREMFLNIHGIPVSPNDFNVVEVILEQI